MFALPRDHKAYRWIAIFAAALFVGRSLHGLRQFSQTIDEPYHIASAMVLWESHRPVIGVQHPPLARWVMGAGLAWAGLELPEAREEQTLAEYVAFDLGKDLLFSGNAPYWRILIVTRTCMLLFPLLLMLFTWKMARWLGGGRAGALAVCFLSVDPTLLGHGFWIGTDVAGAAGFVAALHYGLRWITRPALKRALIAGIVMGLAVGCKYTVLLLLPILILIAALRRLDRKSRPRRRIAIEQPLLFLGSCALILWAIFGFDVAPLGAHQVVFQDHAIWTGLPEALKTSPLPMPAFWMGLLLLIQRNSEGHPTYLLGMISYTGWWYYFPLAVLVKSSLGFLIGMILAIAGWISRPKRRHVVLLVPVIVYFVMSCRSNYQLGIRHLLPMIPLCYVLIASLLRKWAIPLILLAAVETAWIHPDYLSFFNVAAGGPSRGERYLIDSNLDWGQDVARLAQWLKSEEAPPWPYSISVFAGFLPEFKEFGLEPTVLGGEPHRLLAISKNVRHRLVNAKINEQGQIQPGPDFRWLDQYPIVKRIGYSIDVYDLQNLKTVPHTTPAPTEPDPVP